MLRRHGRKKVGAMLISAALMAFSAILHPKEQQMETVRGEVRRKKDAQSGASQERTSGHKAP